MKIQAFAIMTLLAFTSCSVGNNKEKEIRSTDMDTLELTQEWDKTFPQSEKVEHSKIIFHNRYGITLAADLYKPKNAQGTLPAIAMSGPYGAVKEQVSGRYAQTLAERGFLTIAFDPSFYGESGGTPRYLTSPEISTDDFSAAVDYLTTREDVDSERIGILGICGWGGFALNAAANDPRIKATVTSTMYDMSRVNANGYFDAMSADDRYKLRERLNAQRTEDYRDDSYARDGGVLDPVTDDTPQFVKEYHDYYKTERGYHRRSPNSNEGITKTSVLSFINMPLLTYIGEIRSAVLMIAVTGCSANDPQTDSPDTPPVEKPEEPAEPSGNRKILIVYFSHTGNTRTIAGYIHDTVKSDLVEIETVDTYTDDYDTLLAQIREEVATEYCPPLTTRIEGIDLYDVIFIGYPIWVETAAPPIRSFLTTHDLAGKTVVPFCTSGTSSAEALMMPDINPCCSNLMISVVMTGHI